MHWTPGSIGPVVAETCVLNCGLSGSDERVGLTRASGASPFGRLRSAPASPPRHTYRCAIRLSDPGRTRRVRPHTLIQTKKGCTRHPFLVWRRGWDSNPRDAINAYTNSNRAPSTTRPPLLSELKVSFPTYKIPCISFNTSGHKNCKLNL